MPACLNRTTNSRHGKLQPLQFAATKSSNYSLSRLTPAFPRNSPCHLSPLARSPPHSYHCLALGIFLHKTTRAVPIATLPTQLQSSCLSFCRCLFSAMMAVVPNYLFHIGYLSCSTSWLHALLSNSHRFLCMTSSTPPARTGEPPHTLSTGVRFSAFPTPPASKSCETNMYRKRSILHVQGEQNASEATMIDGVCICACVSEWPLKFFSSKRKQN